MIFQDNLRFDKQAKKIYEKLQKRLFLFRYFLFYNRTLTVKIKATLAHSFILSQLRSFLFIWFPHSYSNKLTTLYHETMRLVLGLRPQTPIPTRYSLLNWITIKDLTLLQFLKLLAKIPRLRSDHPLKQEINLHMVMDWIKTKKFPTLYHKQLVQRFATSNRRCSTYSP